MREHFCNKASYEKAGEPVSSAKDGQDIYSKEGPAALDTLNVRLAAGKMEGFLTVMRQFTRAYGGMPKVAGLYGLHEKTLYKSLAPEGNPALKTLLTLANAMNMQIAFLLKEKTT